MDITWINRGLVIVRVGARTLHVGGEALLDRDPDFLIYSRYVTHWEDGSPISDEEKTEILDRQLKSGEARVDIRDRVVMAGSRSPLCHHGNER